jgi:7-cyano-7-deazaguanine synthase in queuosine biosynthesis
MPRVIVNDAVPAEPGDLQIRVNDGARTFRLRPPRFFNSMVDQLRPRVLDLLLIAASVFATDARIRRGGDVRDELGAGWYRDLRFVIPVLDVSFWRSHVAALVATLDFLTGDHFAFEFVARKASARQQPSLALKGGVPHAEEVILFSGGLDSLAGAFETLTDDPSKRVLLVTHRSANKTARIQTALASKLQEMFPDRVLWVPVLGTFVDQDADETSQRSRSFLYAALGYAAASLVGTSRVRFFENGIVSVNLPIDRQVIGTMATRTTHPLFLHHMERLLSGIDRKTVSISNPYQAFTKTEVVDRLVRRGGAELIAQTNSCSRVRRRTTEHPHCGRCSQCLDRRFAILATDAAAFDPIENYGVELWLGIRSAEKDRTMAVDWTRHGRRLAKISPAEFSIAFAAELADLATAYPNRSSAATVSEAFDLHRRHGEAVRRVLAQAIEANRWMAVDANIPADSLLAAVFRDAVDDSLAYSFLPEDASPPETIEEVPMRSISPPPPQGCHFPPQGRSRSGRPTHPSLGRRPRPVQGGTLEAHREAQAPPRSCYSPPAGPRRASIRSDAPARQTGHDRPAGKAVPRGDHRGVRQEGAARPARETACPIQETPRLPDRSGGPIRG